MIKYQEKDSFNKCEICKTSPIIEIKPQIRRENDYMVYWEFTLKSKCECLISRMERVFCIDLEIDKICSKKYTTSEESFEKLISPTILSMRNEWNRFNWPS